MTDQTMPYAPTPAQQEPQYPQQYPQQYREQYPQHDPQQQPTLVQQPKKKRGFWPIFFIVLFSPFIAIYFVLKALYWVFTWVMTPVALAVHFVLCALGLIWFTPVKLLASGSSKNRLLQPRYPGFPPLWSAKYWVRLRERVKATCEFAVVIAQLFS
jgi:hypothetical protein